MLASDGTNSAVWSTPNVLQTVPAWTKGADISGVYQTIRATMTAGSVLAYSPNGTGAPVLKDTFSIDSAINAVQSGAYVTVVGKTYQMVVSGYIDFSNSAPGIRLSDAYHYTDDSWATITFTGTRLDLEDNATPYTPNDTSYSSGHVYSMTRSGTGAVFGGKYLDSVYTDNTGSFTVTVYELSGPSSSAVAFLTAYGATLGGISVVGTAAAGATGFDVQKAGGVSYAAAAGAVYKATTLGGSYSSWYSVPSSANPACLIIPYYRRNSTTLNTSTSTPDVLAACDNGKLYWIDGTAATATDITPTGVTAFSGPNCVTVHYGNHIACYGSVSGAPHFFTSTDGGSTWVDRGAITSPNFIRDRRHDSTGAASGSNKGQLFLVQGATPVVDFSSFWAAGPGSPPDANMWPRNLPFSGVIGVEPIY